MTDEPLMDAKEVAALLGVEVTWVREQSRADRIPTVHLGRYRRYRPQAIREWIETQERHAKSV
jgi:predicted DNA-binding transcriptional regulator AlpA